MPAPKEPTTPIRYYDESPCLGTSFEQVQYKNTAVNTEGDGQDNLFAFVTEPKDIIEDLFKGTDPEPGQAAKDCAAFGGSIRGMGPDCVMEEEEGQRDSVLCFYDFTYECLQKYDTATKDAAKYMAAKRVEGYASASVSNTLVSLDEPRQMQIDANLAYNTCLEEVKDKCECKNCIITITKPNDEEEDDEEDDEPVDDPVTDDPDDPRPITTIETKTTRLTSNYGPIPRVFGRYVVGGNILWLGTKAQETVEHYKTGSAGGLIHFTEEATSCNFIVGVCVGELDSVLRIWFNDILVFNQVMDLNDPSRSSFTDLNLAFLADDNTSGENNYNKIVRVSMHKGSSAQKVLPKAAEQEGFGRVPAYRNIAYVHLDNVDLQLFGGSFPEIRFDVTSVPPAEALNRIDGEEIAGIYVNQLSADSRLGTFVVQKSSTNTAFVIDRDTLNAYKEVPLDFTNWATTTLNGRVISIGADCDLIDPYLLDIDRTNLSRLPYERVDNGPILRQLKYYNSSFYPVELTVYPHLSASTGVAAARHNPAIDGEILDAAYFTDGTGSPANLAPGAMELISWGGSTYAYVLGFDDDTSNFAIVETEILRNGNIISTAGACPTTNYFIPTDAIWGTELDLRVYNHFLDSTDNTVVMFCSVNTETRYFVFKIDPTTREIKWFTECPYTIYFWNEASPITSVYAEDYYYFITTDHKLIRLTRADGTLTQMQDLSALSFPRYQSGSAQYYDGLTRSLTYISTDVGREPLLCRVFVERFADPARVSLATIARSVMEQANFPASLLDVSDIEDITVGGYLIQGKTSLRAIMEEFSEFYRLSLVDDGMKLSIVKQASLNSAITIDPEDDIAQQTLQTRRVVPTSQTDTAIAKYVGIGPNGLTEEIQTVSVAEQNDGDRLPRQKEFDLTIYDGGNFIRAYLEVALQAARADQDVFTARLMPRKLAVTSNDRVALNGKDYRVTGNTLGYDNSAELSASLFFFDVVSETTNQEVVSINTNAYVARKAKAGAYRPRVLFTNALTPEDAVRAFSVRQVAYTLIEADTPDIDPTSVSVYMHAHSRRVINNKYHTASSTRGPTYEYIPRSPIYRSQKHSKAAHSGVLQTAPASRVDGLYSWSKTDSLRVKFHRADTIDLLRNFDPPSAVHQETNANLLIVNGEYIQFAEYEIDATDGSGLTVIFRKLYRGMLGTDTRTRSHFSGEGRVTNTLLPGLRVYLYTPDTILPLGVSAYYTKHRPVARIFLNDTVPVGAAVMDVCISADAGSARAWSPTHPKPYFYIRTDNGDRPAQGTTSPSTTDDRIRITGLISWKRREPMLVDHLSNGGDLTNTYRMNEWIQPYSMGVDVIANPNRADIDLTTTTWSGTILFGYSSHAQFEANYIDWYPAQMQFTYNAQGTAAYTGKDIMRFKSRNPNTPPVTYLPVDSGDTAARNTVIAGVTFDDKNDPTLGYARLVRMPMGYPTTYPAVSSVGFYP